MPDALPGGFQGVRFRASGQKSWLTRPQGPLLLSHGSPSAHPAPALVARAQGGLTLGPEEGELDTDFCHLGKVFCFVI
jgi:hypothetical protein